MGCLGKFGVLFVIILDLVIGGFFMVVFGMFLKLVFINIYSEFVKKKKVLICLGFILLI